MEYECEVCDREFKAYSSLVQHCNDTGHLPFSCGCCDPRRYFCLTTVGKQHERDNLYCGDCERQFASESNIHHHLNSRIHRPAGSISCPFCRSKYTSATGLCHHLERGACDQAPNLDRDEVFRIVRQRDPTGLISNKLLGWHGSTEYEANEQSWNGSGYECYICNRNFSLLRGLNQHLNSPIHQAKLYHCPNKQTCARQFTTLAAFMNHLESESCEFMRFSQVQNAAQNIFTSNRMLQF